MARKKLFPMPSDRFQYLEYLCNKLEEIPEERWAAWNKETEKWRQEKLAEMEKERNIPKPRRYEPLTGTWHCPECGRVLEDDCFECTWIICKQKLY